LQRPISITLLKVKGSPLENTHCAQAGTVWGSLLSRLIAEVAGTSAFKGMFYCWSDPAVAHSWI